ncbi:MAG TPA: YceH family protein [Acidimicrobiia bacterium]|nr:YceH family protein [Acidimicrobiia bacterium]
MEALTPEAARVLGALVEKDFTTPDAYPLTTNALVAACNQASNRDPVVAYDEATVLRALRDLEDRRLANLTRASGGRTVRYVHRVQSGLELDDEQTALLAVLLLRGAQTPGELRARTDRYVSFGATADVEERLVDLMARTVPLVERLERAPGQKENRYRCLLIADGAGEQPVVSATADPRTDRLAGLERRVAAIEEALGITPGEM